MICNAVDFRFSVRRVKGRAAPGGRAGKPARPPGAASRSLLIAALLVVIGEGAVAQVCAPLEGTAGYSQCINDQLTRMRTDPPVPTSDPRLGTTLPEVTPRPVARPDYLNTNPSLQVPTNDPSGTATNARNVDAAQRNSDLRTNLLRQQVQRDLRTTPGTVPRTGSTMRLQPVAPMTFP